MGLCMNRYPLPGAPSTCLLDTVLIPLSPWILLATFPLYAWWTRAWWRIPPPPIRDRLAKIIHILYLVLLVCALGMAILEVARLIANGEGIGLLAFTFPGFILSFLTVLRRGVTYAPLFHVWTVWIAMEAVKVNRMILLNQLDPATDSKYPSSDKLIDNSVDLGLLVLFLLFDIYEFFVTRRTRPNADLIKHTENIELSGAADVQRWTSDE